MQDLGYELPRILIPRTRVNRGKEFQYLGYGRQWLRGIGKGVHAMAERRHYEWQQELHSREEFVELARRALASFPERVLELPEVDNSLREATNSLREATNSLVEAEALDHISSLDVGVAGSLSNDHISCFAQYKDGPSRLFTGDSPQVSPRGEDPFSFSFQGVGKSFIPPNELVGDAEFGGAVVESLKMGIVWRRERPTGEREKKNLMVVFADVFSSQNAGSVDFAGRGTWTET